MIRSSRAYLFHRFVVWKDNGFQCATEERNDPYLPQESQTIVVIMDIRVSHIYIYIYMYKPTVVILRTSPGSYVDRF